MDANVARVLAAGIAAGGAIGKAVLDGRTVRHVAKLGLYGKVAAGALVLAGVVVRYGPKAYETLSARKEID